MMGDIIASCFVCSRPYVYGKLKLNDPIFNVCPGEYKAKVPVSTWKAEGGGDTGTYYIVVSIEVPETLKDKNVCDNCRNIIMEQGKFIGSVMFRSFMKERTDD
jgi:hypothetical protein